MIEPRMLFRIVIASFGLANFLAGILYLFDSATFVIGLAEPSQHLTTQWYAVRGVFKMLMGFLLMGGMPQFIRLAFPEPLESNDGEALETTPKNPSD
ncbi:MAG TPA: hypothetical protein VND64_27880 [Pirellulales bacterium]|nr:hypothetical protein [Pirellulales bacterium]